MTVASDTKNPMLHVMSLRDFRLLFAGATTSLLGDQFALIATPWLVLQVTGSASRIEFRPLPADDPKQRRPDISKARRLLGWEPKISLESGLKLSLEYFKKAVLAASAAKPSL